MTVYAKSLEVCKECIQINKFPPCGVNTFFKGGELITISNDKFKNSKVQNYIVCPVDAIKPSKEGIKFLDDRCVSCGLCINKCPYNNIGINGDIEENAIQYLNNDILKIASFLRSSLEDDFEISTEVKAHGNSRDKRIDIVVKSSNKIYLIKVLPKLSSLGKYERSYTAILEASAEELETDSEVIFLYCEEREIRKITTKEINNKSVLFLHISLENILPYLKGEGGN